MVMQVVAANRRKNMAGSGGLRVGGSMQGLKGGFSNNVIMLSLP